MPSSSLIPPIPPDSGGVVDGGQSHKAKINSEKENTHKIVLVRPEKGGGGSFGFSIRGGLEHQLGIYVSHVDVGSEAHLQGLQVGYNQVLIIIK